MVFLNSVKSSELLESLIASGQVNLINKDLGLQIKLLLQVLGFRRIKEIFHEHV